MVRKSRETEGRPITRNTIKTFVYLSKIMYILNSDTMYLRRNKSTYTEIMRSFT